jgi:hypothetical protein
LAFLGFAFVLVRLGMLHTQRAIILHSAGLSIFGQLLWITVASIPAPGFRNTVEPFEISVLQYLLSIVILGICLFVPAEVGHLLVRKKFTQPKAPPLKRL